MDIQYVVSLQRQIFYPYLQFMLHQRLWGRVSFFILDITQVYILHVPYVNYMYLVFVLAINVRIKKKMFQWLCQLGMVKRVVKIDCVSPSVCNYRSIEGSHKTKAGFCTGARVSSDTYYIYLNRTAFEGLPAPFRLGHRFSGYNVVFQAEILAIPQYRRWMICDSKFKRNIAILSIIKLPSKRWSQ